MWAVGNSMASFHAMMNEIHVLLVDDDYEVLAKQLQMCQYRVTCLEYASVAISTLLSGEAKFDVVIANIYSRDHQGPKLLEHAVAMGLPVVLMSADDNASMAMWALKNGAFLYIKKPVTMEILRCLWQHVVREKSRMINRERDMLMAANNHGSVRGVEFREVVENPNNGGMAMVNKGKNKKRKGRQGDEEYGLENNTMMQNGNVRRKMCTEWTQELHAKFMDVVDQLGEGRCFPKEILERMNVPGLTRMQVASHLQKCRNDNWRSPEERKPHQTTQPTIEDTNESQHKPRRFGSKPQVKRARFQSTETLVTGQGSETHSEAETSKNGANIGNGSSIMNNSHHHQYYGSVEPGPSNATTGTNEYFFSDMGILIQNYPGEQQGSGINNPNPAQGAYQYDQAHNDEQKSGGTSIETKSNWSSETSILQSNHSESKGHNE